MRQKSCTACGLGRRPYARPRSRSPETAHVYGVGLRGRCAPLRSAPRAPFADRGSWHSAPLRGAHLRPLPERNSHGHLPSELPRLLARHRGGRGQEGRVPVGPGACGRADGAALRLCQEGTRRRGGSVSARWRAAHRARRALERGRAGMGRGRRRQRARRAAL